MRRSALASAMGVGLLLCGAVSQASAASLEEQVRKLRAEIRTPRIELNKIHSFRYFWVRLPNCLATIGKRCADQVAARKANLLCHIAKNCQPLAIRSFAPLRRIVDRTLNRLFNPVMRSLHKFADYQFRSRRIT